MTIALAINVGDSLVLASDSATTQTMTSASGQLGTSNIWNSANKIFNLHKGLPIGAMTWGEAALDDMSISTLSKDLRARLSGQDTVHADWALDPTAYSIEDVAHRAKEFFYTERATKPASQFGLMVAGYSAGKSSAEWFTISADATGCTDPTPVLGPGEPGVVTYGQPEAFSRLINGVSSNLPQALTNLGVPAADAEAYTEAIAQQVSQPVAFPGMPIGEVIELADFLVETTIRFVRFTPGAATVGGPIEIAALTKHEGFKWVQRKHHYPASLNP